MSDAKDELQPPQKKKKTDNNETDLTESDDDKSDKECEDCGTKLTEEEQSLILDGLCRECSPHCIRCHEQDKRVRAGCDYCASCYRIRQKGMWKYCDRCEGKFHDSDVDDDKIYCDDCEENMTEEDDSDDDE